MKQLIKNVTSYNQLGDISYTIGVNGVAEIKDNSIEFENNIHIQFDAYNKDGKLIGTFINGALIVEYLT